MHSRYGNFEEIPWDRECCCHLWVRRSKEVKADIDVGIHQLIDPFFTNDWERLIGRTVVFMEPFLNKRGVSSKSEKIQAAERLWFIHAMKDTKVAAENGKLRHLFCEERDGMVVVVGRAKKGMQTFLVKKHERT